jgi:uncharacterized membrane protein YqjE
MSESPESPGVLATLRGMGATLSAMVANRVELVLVELQLERARFFQILILLLITLALAFLSILALTAAVVVALWKTNPIVVLTVIGLMYGVGAWMTVRKARELLGHDAFSGSLGELKKDQTWLNQTLSRPSSSGDASSSPKAS